MKKFVYLSIFILFFSTKLSAQRIITAGSSSTEIVCALGLCDKIVATDKTSVYPAEMQNLPSIGYRSSITAEGIISYAPDILILEKGYVKDVILEQVKNAGKTLVITENKHTLENTKHRIRTIARSLDKVQEGEALIKKIEMDYDALEKRVAKVSTRPKVLCVYARGGGTMHVAGDHTGFMLVKVAGMENAVQGVEGYKPLSTEALISANPDYILFFNSGLESLWGLDGVLQLPGVAQTIAGKKEQIISMDGVKLTNWGPRFVEAANELFEMTHPK